MFGEIFWWMANAIHNGTFGFVLFQLIVAGRWWCAAAGCNTLCNPL